nr:N-acetylmuramoyl-L-alanine amidase [Armatimonas rosea]
MQRVIIHWSEGRNLSNDTDREHYHLLIEQAEAGQVRVIRGDHSIADNASTGDGDYAAHTRDCNTGSIGVALCGMMGCQESPFQAGPAPITLAQWRLLEQVVAELCQRYRIAVTPETVLCHGEVQRNLNIRQRGKWDPMRWPWDLSVPGSQIGSQFRIAVQGRISVAAMSKGATAPIQPPTPTRRVILPDSLVIDAPTVRVEDGETWLGLRYIADHYGWTIKTTTTNSATVAISGVDHTLELDIDGGTGYVPVRQVAELLGASVSWDGPNKTVTLAKELSQ